MSRKNKADLESELMFCQRGNKVLLGFCLVVSVLALFFGIAFFVDHIKDNDCTIIDYDISIPVPEELDVCILNDLEFDCQKLREDYVKLEKDCQAFINYCSKKLDVEE